MSDDRDETVLELLARDLDGDLDRDERRVLYAALADHPDSSSLLRAATDLKHATDTLAAACAATPTPDMTGFILDALARDAEATSAANKTAARGAGLFGALKSALSRGRQQQRDGGIPSGGWQLGTDDLRGVVAGTGASAEDADGTAAHQEPDETAAPDRDAEVDQSRDQR